jgi:hypothetical protein
MWLDVSTGSSASGREAGKGKEPVEGEVEKL